MSKKSITSTSYFFSNLVVFFIFFVIFILVTSYLPPVRQDQEGINCNIYFIDYEILQPLFR
jgi:hypothetical protein